MVPSLRKVHRNKPEQFQSVKPRIGIMKNKMLTTDYWKLSPKFIVSMKCIFFNHSPWLK